jgi:Coiled-coil domain-containing protein 124 /Oxs1
LRREAATAKAAEAARKKAERAALEAEEMASLKSAKAGNAKSAEKKTNAVAPRRGLDLAQLDAEPSTTPAALNASGIENALDALDITHGANDSVDRHPERRFKAAFMAFEAKRLEEMKDDKTLRRQQKIDMIRKEFEKSPDNPFNQVAARYNATKDDIQQMKQAEKEQTETRLAGSS